MRESKDEYSFDKDYWDQHWRADRSGARAALVPSPPNPHLVREIEDLEPGTALEAGCGAGAEAMWLAARGWQVTGVDIAAAALDRAAGRAAAMGAPDRVKWITADLSDWEPPTAFDLVTTHYAHPAIPQLEFYDRIAQWVAPGGTLLIVGHGDHAHGHSEGGPPAAASVTTAGVTARLDPAAWEIVTAEERRRTLAGHGGGMVTLHDVVVRAVRRRAATRTARPR